MGWALGWAAFHGIERKAVLEVLGLREAAGSYDYQDREAFGAVDLPGGWSLVVSRDCEYFYDPKQMREWSRGCRVIAVGVEEHVMFSFAAEWRDGSQLWIVEHNGGDNGAMDLRDAGNPPSRFNELRRETLVLQEDDDEVDHVFEVPLQLAREIAGFSHDEEGAEDRYVRLEPEDLGQRKGGLFGWARRQ